MATWRAPADAGTSLAFACLFCFALATLCLGVLCHSWWAAKRLWRWRASLPTAAASVRRLLRPHLWGADKAVDPEVEVQVRDKITAKQVQLARVIIPCLCVVAVRRAVGAASHIWSGAPSPRSAAQDGAFALIYAGLGLCFLVPRLISARSLPLWHVFFMAGSYILCTPLAIPIDQVMWISVYQTKSFCFSLALSLMCMNLPVLVVTNLLYSSGMVIGMMVAVPEDADLPMSEMIALEASYCLLKLAIFYILTNLVHQSVRAEVEARAGACQRSAVSSLLGMMCDAVVELDQGLAMKDHAGKLAGMLMHGTGTTLRGRPLVEFLAGAEDRQRFEDAIARCASDDCGTLHPSMLSLSLRDAIGNVIRSVLYHVPYSSVAGRTHHLVGLREDTETPQGVAVDSLGTSAGRAVMPAAVLTAAALRGVRRSRRRGLRRGPATVSSESSGSSSPSASDGDVLLAEVFASEVLPMNRISRQFTSEFNIAGDPVGRSFRALLPEAMGNRFTDWVCSQAGKVQAGDIEGFVDVFGEVEILTASPPSGRRWRCEVCFPKPHTELQRRQMYLVGIRLTHSRAPDDAPVSPRIGLLGAPCPPEALGVSKAASHIGGAPRSMRL